jgi:hypothetical protein
VHTPLWQSAPTLQVFDVAHLEHDPPQSTSVSLPFFEPSEHVAVWHLSGDPEHTVLVQSAGTPHSLPSAHLEHDPPQSTSLSMPFLTVSEHVATEQRPVLHTLL